VAASPHSADNPRQRSAPKSGHSKRRRNSIPRGGWWVILAFVGFPLGMFIDLLLFRDPNKRIESVWATVAGLGAIAVVLVGLVLLGSHLRRLDKRQAAVTRPDSVKVIRVTPPDRVKPGMAARLIRGAERRAPLATLADLVARKVILVRSADIGQWTLRPSPDVGGDSLMPHERELLRRLFGPTARERFYLPRQWKRFQRIMARDVIASDLLKQNLIGRRASANRYWPGWGLLLGMAFGCGPILIGPMPILGWTLLVGGVAFIFVGRLFDLAYMPTAAGREIVRQTYEFGRYLHTAEVEQLQWQMDSGIIAGYVPWAIALGDLQLWSGWQLKHRQSEDDTSDLARLFGYLFELAQSPNARPSAGVIGIKPADA